MTFPDDWPGVGPEVPEPEPEGFREEETEKEKARQLQEEADQLERAKDLKAHYSGRSNETDPQPKSTSHKSTSHKASDKDTGVTTSYSSGTTATKKH